MLKRKGFTLIELLIVIAIIAILAGIVIASTTGATKKARDSRRVGDIQSLQTAIVQYEADNGRYPASLNDLVTGGYISSIPADADGNPSTVTENAATDDGLIYVVSVDGDKYLLAANLERDDNKALAGDIDDGDLTTPGVQAVTITTTNGDVSIDCDDADGCAGASTNVHCYCIGIVH